MQRTRWGDRQGALCTGFTLVISYFILTFWLLRPGKMQGFFFLLRVAVSPKLKFRVSGIIAVECREGTLQR